MSRQALLAYYIIPCGYRHETLRIDGKLLANTSPLEEGFHFGDFADPILIESVRQLRANTLHCRGFNISPHIYVHEIAHLRWCLSQAQHISFLFFYFTQPEQLLKCLATTEYAFAQSLRAVEMNCEPAELRDINVDLFLRSLSNFVHYVSHRSGWTQDYYKTYSFFAAIQLFFEVRQNFTSLYRSFIVPYGPILGEYIFSENLND